MPYFTNEEKKNIEFSRKYHPRKTRNLSDEDVLKLYHIEEANEEKKLQDFKIGKIGPIHKTESVPKRADIPSELSHVLVELENAFRASDYDKVEELREQYNPKLEELSATLKEPRVDQ